MEPIDSLILFVILMIFLSIGLTGYYIFLYREEGEKCEIDDDADEFLICMTPFFAV